MARPRKKRLLLFVRGIGEFTETLTNAELLVDKYKLIIVSDFPLDNDGKIALQTRAKKIGCKCYDISPAKVKKNLNRISQNQEKNFQNNFRKRVKKFSKEYILQFDSPLYKPFFFLPQDKIKERIKEMKKGFFSLFFLLGLKRRAFIDVLNKTNPDLFIINNVNGGTHSEIYIKEARKRGIKSILIPFTFVSPIAPAKAYSNNPNYNPTGFKKLFLKIFARRWFFKLGDKDMVRVPFGHILVHKVFRIEPPKPWVQDSSTVDMLVAESQFTFDHYRRLGINPKKMTLAGKPNMGFLAKVKRNRKRIENQLVKKLKFQEKKPTILLAIPPALEALFSKPQYKSEFKNHTQIIKFWISAVKSLKKFNVIICLHPSLKADPEKMEFFESLESENIRVSTEDTAKLLSISDLYIAAGSGTIIWALALGVPVVDYDVYGLNFDFFKNNDDVITIKTKKDFRELIKRIKKTPSILEDKKAALNEKEGYYGVLDGKSIERINAIIEDLT